MNKAMQVCEALEDKYNEKRIKNEYESGIVMGIQICVEAIRDLPADPVSGDDFARLMAENERHEELFEQIDKWADAYPTDLWPEVAKEDWKRIGQALDDNGLPSLDRISASNMRHVITRIKEQADIARAALKGETK